MSKLAHISFFADAGLDLEPFEARCHWRRYQPDETLIDFDEESSDVYFIVQGEVRVLIRTAGGKEIILGDMKAGQMFGELAALDGIKRSANVTALTSGTACLMPALVFRDLVFASPAVAERVLRLLSGRVRELNARLMEQSILDVRHRLYAELLRLAVPRSGHTKEWIVTPPPYHHVLAARIGCRREQVTREFTALVQESLMEKTRGGLVLKQPDVLKGRIERALREEG